MMVSINCIVSFKVLLRTAKKNGGCVKVLDIPTRFHVLFRQDERTSLRLEAGYPGPFPNLEAGCRYTEDALLSAASRWSDLSVSEAREIQVRVCMSFEIITVF